MVNASQISSWKWHSSRKETIYLSKIKYDVLKVEYLYEKISNFTESGSFNYRIGNTFDDLFSFTQFKMLFGVGLGNIDVIYNKGSTYSVVFIEQGLFYGGLFFISIFFLLRSFKVRYYNIFYIFILFFGTYTFSQFQFWFLIISVSIISYNNKNKIYSRGD